MHIYIFFSSLITLFMSSCNYFGGFYFRMRSLNQFLRDFVLQMQCPS